MPPRRNQRAAELTAARAEIERILAGVAAAVVQLEEGVAEAHEAMDDDEKFEALQTENVMASNPESLAYFRANKAMMRKRGGKPLRA